MKRRVIKKIFIVEERSRDERHSLCSQYFSPLHISQSLILFRLFNILVRVVVSGHNWLHSVSLVQCRIEIRENG